MENRIRHSLLESQITGIKTGRWTADSVDPDQLVEAIAEEEWELVKLNLNAEDPELYIKLDQIGLKYYVVGMVQQYRINFNKIQPKALYHADVTFEELGPANTVILKDLVAKCFAKTPGSFYLNPLLKDKQPEYLELLCEYISRYQPMFNAHHYCHLLMHQGKYVGFIAHRYDNTNGYADYAGVINTTHQPGFYIDLVRFIQNYCLEKGIRWGFASAQIQNTVVHKVYQKEDMVPYHSMVNVHINL